MTVGFYSPLPPARTGVADYSAALLAELRRRGHVEINPDRCDVALYHLGNNPLHAEACERALSQPGVVVLHDAVLNHFHLGRVTEAVYVSEFVSQYGEWNRGLAAELWQGRAASGADERYFQYPMLRRVLERALAVVVHNPGAAAIVRRELDLIPPSARASTPAVIEIPHLHRTPDQAPAQSAVVRYRQRLGIEPGAFLFGVFGYLRESKRLLNVLDAFAELRRERPHVGLLVAGSFVSTDLERAATPLLSAPGVVRRSFLAESEFGLAAASVDACVNLRHPAAGETSGIAIRLMGLGKPVLVTDSPEYSRFPEDACVRIPAGHAERESLLQHFRLLTSMTEAAAAIGQRGARHIADRHRLDRIGDTYWELLRAHCI